MDSLIKYGVPIGIFATLLTSVMGIVINRINSRSTKYIDTITSERIKWIEKLRLEVADLNSIFLTIIKNHTFIVELKDERERTKEISNTVNILRNIEDLQKEISTFSKTDIL